MGKRPVKETDYWVGFGKGHKEFYHHSTPSLREAGERMQELFEKKYGVIDGRKGKRKG